MVSGFERLLSYMRAVSKSKNDQGLRFEQLIKKFFIVSPLYSQLYENVWIWNEFPYNGNKHDYGIDLVAKMRGIDEYHAIQCKFYKENYAVTKEDVDTFLSASGQPFYINNSQVRFSNRIIVSTTDKWTSNSKLP